MCKKLILLVAVFLICCVRASAQEDPNLAAYWNFDDGAVTDLSGNGNNGTLIGLAGLNDNPLWTFGGTGISLDLNYQNRNTDWAEIPHSDSLNITHELSILLWIRPDDIENWDALVCKGTTKSPWALRFNEENGLRFCVNYWYNLNDPADPNYAPGAVGSGDRQSQFEVPEVNEPIGIDWSFVGVISDTKALRFILDLDEEVYPVRYIFADSNEPLILGAFFTADYGTSSPQFDYFNGLMDEVRIYNRALSRREVMAISGLATKPFEPEPADGAVGVTSGTLTWGSIEGVEKVYLGTNAEALELVSEDAKGTYTIAEIIPGRQYFWRVDVVTAEGVVTGDVWTFTLAGNVPSVPNPSENAEFVDVEGISLSWAPAFGATAYDVYFGMNPDNLELLGQVTESSYEDPDRRLVSETLHYWRIDTVRNGDVVTGPVWSFKTMPVFAVEEALVGWYKFELGEGTTAVDWTRKGNEGTLIGDAKWIENGYAGRALEFDGAGDYVEIPRVIQDDWTIMLWLRTEDLTQGGGGNRFRTNSSALIDGDFGSQLENFAMTFKSGNIVAGCTMPGVGAAASLISNTAISDTQWHHVAWTRDSTTGEMILYMDGALDASETRTDDAWKGTKDAQDHIKIGMHDYANSQGFFTGQLDEVKFFTRVLNETEVKVEMRPDKRIAFSPQPVPGAVLQQEIPVTLAWTAGFGATAHSVYLGTSQDDLQLVSAAQSATEYDLGLLDPGTYYWQVIEIQADGAEIKGEIWSFVIAEYLIVDDFESYNDLDPTDPNSNRIFNAWIDGYEQPTNGSIVGYAVPPFCEQTIVHSGGQSMPLFYDNSVTANYSEAQRSFSPPQDWTRKGVKALSLWFRGNPAAFVEEPAGTYTINASGADIWAQADEFRYVWKELSGDGEIIAQVLSVQQTDGWAKAGVMIRNTLGPESANAMAYITDSGRVGWQYRSFAADVSVSTRSDTGVVTAPHWVKLSRQGNIITAQHSSDGVTWEDMIETANPQEPSFANIVMNPIVYVGLALTSHASGVNCEAEFSGVTITGAVSGQFTEQAIGVDMPASDPAAMYVALASSGGTPAVVYHADHGATQIGTWTEWRIDLQEFSDVNLANVDKLSIGFGDKANPQPGGSGKMYFDDIRLYPPAP